MHNIRSRGFALLGIAAIAAAACSAAKAEKIVITQGNMASKGWVSAIQQGTYNYGASISQMPLLEWVNGPGLTPAGDGSLHMQVFYSDSDPLSKVFVGTNAFEGVPLTRITKLKYCTYVHWREYDDSMPPILELTTDSGPSFQQRQFWFLPWGENGATNAQMRTWQEWDLMAPGARWEQIHTGRPDYYGDWNWVVNLYPGLKLQAPKVGDYLDYYSIPDYKLHNQTGTCLSIKIGSGKAADSRYGAWWRKQAGVNGYVDKLIIGIDGVDYEYDFESAIIPAVTINNSAAGDPIMAQAKKNFKFTVFGRVDFNDSFSIDTFTVDDGSGKPILVKAPGHTINPFDYARATGILDPTTNPPTLTSSAELVQSLAAFGEY